MSLLEWREPYDGAYVLYRVLPDADVAIAKIMSFRGRQFDCTIFNTQENGTFNCFDSLSYLSSTWSNWRSKRTLKRAKEWCEEKAGPSIV